MLIKALLKDFANTDVCVGKKGRMGEITDAREWYEGGLEEIVRDWQSEVEMEKRYDAIETESTGRLDGVRL